MEFGTGAFRDGLYGLDGAAEVLRLIFILVVMGLLVHWAAQMVVKKSTLFQAMAAAVLAFLAFYLVLQIVIVPAIAFVLGAVAFAAVIGLVYKTKDWTKGASIGALAWAMFYLAGILMQWVVGLV